MLKKYTILILTVLLMFSVLLAGCREEEVEEEQIEQIATFLEDDNLIEGFIEFKELLKEIDSNEVQEEFIDEFFALLDDQDFPLRGDDKLIFLYRADDAEDKVEFASDLTLWQREEMVQISDSSLYYKDLELNRGISFDYLFWVDDQAEIDEFNTNIVASRYFEELNNLELNDYQAPDYWKLESEQQGDLVEGDNYQYYLPVDYNSEQEYALLYFIGEDYLESGAIKNTLDNLNQKDKLNNYLAVFVDDMALEDRQLNLLLSETNQTLAEDYSISDAPEDQYLISYGNYANQLVDVVINNYDKYKNLLLQSPEFYSLPELSDEADDINVYLDWGEFSHSQKSAMNLDFVHSLQKNDFNYLALVHPSGNQWSNWRANIYYGLEYLLGENELTVEEEELIISDDFTTDDSIYFSDLEKDNGRFIRDEGSYNLEFNDSQSIEIDNYRFKNFELSMELVELEGNFGFTILGENDYTIIKDTSEKKIYLSSLNEDAFEEVSFSDGFNLERIEIVSEDDELKFLINDILMDDLTIEQNSSKQLAFIGSAGTEVEIDNIEIIEQLN